MIFWTGFTVGAIVGLFGAAVLLQEGAFVDRRNPKYEAAKPKKPDSLPTAKTTPPPPTSGIQSVADNVRVLEKSFREMGGRST